MEIVGKLSEGNKHENCAAYLIVLGYKRVCMLASIPVSQGSLGLDLIDHRMRHCSKLGDSNKKNISNVF